MSDRSAVASDREVVPLAKVHTACVRVLSKLARILNDSEQERNY